MAAGEGALHPNSKGQGLVAKSSTEAGLVAAGGGISQTLWAKCSPEQQGCGLRGTALCQGNQPATLLGQGGGAPSTKRARHINIRYPYVTDVVKDREEVGTHHLPADLLAGGYSTKPLAGAAPYRVRNDILGIGPNGRHTYDRVHEHHAQPKQQ